MKSIIISVGCVMTLLSLSFVNTQKEVVRLENGNYQLYNLKMENEDVEAIQKKLEEMAKYIYKENGSEPKKGDEKEPDFDDLLTIYESAEGFEAVLAFGNEEEHYVLTDEIALDAIKETFVYRAKDKDDEHREALMSGIHDIMSKYL